MKRNIIWGFSAIVPICLCFLLFFWQNHNVIQKYASLLPFEFWQEKWLFFSMLFLMLTWLIYIGHALYKKNYLWSLLIFLFAWLIIPIYWWLKSESTKNA